MDSEWIDARPEGTSVPLTSHFEAIFCPPTNSDHLSSYKHLCELQPTSVAWEINGKWPGVSTFVGLVQKKEEKQVQRMSFSGSMEPSIW